MKIGLDFDGVLSDCGFLKSLGACRLYGVQIPPEKSSKELVLKHGFLTEEQYETLQEVVYGTDTYLRKMREVPEAFQNIERLQEDGHNLTIITARGGIMGSIALRWLARHNVRLPFFAVGKKAGKREACKGLDIYIDDDLKNLLALNDVVPKRFLFSWGYNEHCQAEEDGITRVSSWTDFYHKISCLQEESDSSSIS